MTIETGPAQSTASRPPAESANAKGRPGEAQGHGSGGKGAFMSILASLGPSDPGGAGPVGGAAALSDTENSTLAALSRALGAQRWGHPSGATGGADRTSLSDKDALGDSASLGERLAKLLNSSGATDATEVGLPVVDNSLQKDIPMDAAALLAQAAQWTTAPMTANAEVANTGSAATGNQAGATKLPNVQSALDAGGTRATAIADAVSEQASKAANARKDVLARFASDQAALTALPSETGNQATDARQTQFAQKDAGTSNAAIATTLASVATPATTLMSPRREEFARERSVFRANAVDNSSSVSQSYMPSASGISGPSALDPVTPTDTYIAEKVAYWISNDVQNAEMKLDGIGDKPVEVSIRMQGNEAHIAFRSDELQARAALENASAHLKDMLQREGLVLSGVSVGTSGTGDPGGQERNPRQGARHSAVASVQPARVDRVPGGGRASGGLDLFV